ncbi:hypothetical protein HJ590_14435 [Naumannella sp. ID2617S]|nr:hypothetical protein [Naumannella sp. ID2617S]
MLAPDLPAAFRVLCWVDDPRNPVQQYASGGDLVREITDAALPGDLGQRLIEFACRALVDWRSQLDLPVLDPISWHAATNHARATDEVVRTLIAHGARVDQQSLAHLASNNGNELADLAQRLDGTIDNRGARAAALVLLDVLGEALGSARRNNPGGDHALLRGRIARTGAYAKHKGGLWRW